MVGRVIEVSFVLILVFLVVTNSQGFYTALSGIGQTYVGAVKTLQGR
jgi:hypothetical protein